MPRRRRWPRRCSSTSWSAAAAPFVDEGQAELAASELKRRLTASQLFREFTRKEAAGAAKLPSFNFDSRIWRAATDSRGRTVSPWALFSSRLLLFYFFVHLRYLPPRLSEYSRLFLLTRLQQWGDYLAGRRDELWNGAGATKGLGEQIRETLVGVLGGEYGAARSLAQAGRLLDKVREACELRGLGTLLTQLDEYGRLEVFSVPEELREFYESAPEVLEAKSEQELYDGLVERIQRHPLPLALFGRAALVSVMFAVLGERLLDFLSPNVLNLGALLRWPPLTLAVLGAVPLGVALWRYWVRTVREVRKAVNMYVAGVLRHAQTKAKDAVELEVSRLCEQARAYCSELEGHLGRVRDGLAAPDAEEYTYRMTTFHRPLTGDLAIPGRGRSVSILSNGGMECRISVGGEWLLFEECDEEMLGVMLNRFLDARDEPGQRAAWELLAPPPPRAAGDAPADGAALDLFCRAALDYAEGLYEDEQQIRLDRWLLSDDQRHCADTLDRLRRLASPPLTFHSGASQPPPARSEWKYHDPARIVPLVGDAGDARRASGDGSVLSLASYQPFGLIGSAPYAGLENVATVRALVGDPQAVAADRAADTPARRFTAAAARLPSSPDLTIVSAADGQVFQAVAAEAEIEALRRRLGLAAEEETDPEL